MELDIRNRDKSEKVARIRWADGVENHGTIRLMDHDSCLIEDTDGDDIYVAINEIDNLIAALQKYKELYS